MDSYRPPRDSDYDSGDGFQIRGAASRQHHHQDRPSRRERDDRYYSNSDDYHFRHRFDGGPSDTYYDTSRHPYSDEYDIYDEPSEPPANTGDNDIANTEATIPFLLVRGLKPNVDEGKLSKGLEKLYIDDSELSTAPKPNVMPAVQGTGLPPPLGAPSQPPLGASPSSLKRVFLIRDRLTDKTMQYGFAEYFDLKNARGALNKANKLDDRCTISSKQIAVDFPHAGVFCPPLLAGSSDPDPRFQFENDSGSIFAYYDQRYYASSFMVNAKPPVRPKSSLSPKAVTTKTVKKRVNDSSDADTLDKEGGAKPKKPKTGPNFDMWQKKQDELRGETGESNEETMPDKLDGSETNHESEIGISYIVPGEKIGKAGNINVCLLCGTALGAAVEPEAHAHKSELHLLNLKDGDKIKKAHERLNNFGKNFEVTKQDFIKLKFGPGRYDPEPQYRDRAKERRQEEVKSGMTKKINMSLKPALKDRSTKSSASQESTAALSSSTKSPSYGMGLKMLQKAGWSEGQGLGSGDGIAAPIEQNMYAAGVGLGHEGSKKGDAVEEAARMTKDDRGSFLEKTRDLARERLKKME